VISRSIRGARFTRNSIDESQRPDVHAGYSHKKGV
jgi:hypothetical protein